MCEAPIKTNSSIPNQHRLTRSTQPKLVGNAQPQSEEPKSINRHRPIGHRPIGRDNLSLPNRRCPPLAIEYECPHTTPINHYLRIIEPRLFHANVFAAYVVLPHAWRLTWSNLVVHACKYDRSVPCTWIQMDSNELHKITSKGCLYIHVHLPSNPFASRNMCLHRGIFSTSVGASRVTRVMKHASKACPCLSRRSAKVSVSKFTVACTATSQRRLPSMRWPRFRRVMAFAARSLPPPRTPPTEHRGDEAMWLVR